MSNIVGKEILEKLALPFDPKDIEWRVQSATRSPQGQIKLLVLPYIESRAVMNRFDEVCGANWQTHYDKIVVNGKEAFQCRLSIKIGDEWITRTDAAEVSDIESVKGGHSNALKRAAVQWGVGRYLYDCPTYWVDLKPQGVHRVWGNFKINGKQEVIQGYFDTPQLPDWALPPGVKQQPSKFPNSQSQTTQPMTPQQDPKLAEKQKNAIIKIKGLLQTLNIQAKYVQRIMKKAGKIEGDWEKANLQQLTNVYKVLQPPASYVKECQKINLTTRELLDYAQITLKEPLNATVQLLFKMDREIAKETLELIKADRQIAS